MKRPIHQLLRQYRIAQMGVISFLCYITYIFTSWIVADPYKDLSEWQLAVVVTAFPALLTGLFALVKTLMVRTEKDEHDN